MTKHKALDPSDDIDRLEKREEEDLPALKTAAWTAIDWLPIIWKSDQTDKIKSSIDTAISLPYMDAN